MTTSNAVANIETVTNAAEILDFQKLVRMVPIAESVAKYAVDFIRATRPVEATAPDFVKKYVNFGASVRATQFLVLASKARALMHGRYHVAYEDIRALALPILRHRVLLNFHAESERMTSDDILKRILEVRSAQS
jgi:MoxR-like ATPase